MNFLLMQRFRVPGVIYLPQCLPAFFFQISFLIILHFDDDPGIGVIDPYHDITESIAGFPVGTDHPAILKTQNSKKDARFSFQQSITEFPYHMTKKITFFKKGGSGIRRILLIII